MYLNYNSYSGIRRPALWFIPLILSCFFQFRAVAQRATFEQKRAQLDNAFEHSKEPSITALYFFRKLDHNEFRDIREWRKTLSYIEIKAHDSHGGYYAQLCTEIAEQLHRMGQYQDSYYFLYKARNEIRVNPPKDKRFLIRFHKCIGLIFYYFQRFNDARIHFHHAAAVPNITDHDKIDILNTIGLINRDQGYADSSRIYFEKALIVAKKLNHTPWMAVISGNLGQYYWIRKNYAKARELCEFDARYSLETGQIGSAVNALCLLIDMDLHDNNTAAARQKLEHVEHLIKKQYDPGQYRVYYSARTAVQEKIGNHKDALDSYRKVVRYLDTLRKKTAIENIRKTEFQVDFERKQSEVSLLHEKKKRDEIIIYGLLGITMVIILVFVVIINLIAKRRRREKEISRLKQSQIEQELYNTEKEMRSILSNLMEKNELVEQLTEEIHQFQTSPEEELSEEKVKMLNTLQSFTLLTDDDWLEFKKLFEKLNPNFFNKVISQAPELTNAEIRLITLIKLNLSNLEMSRALGISPDSVRKTSLRLRKKLNIELHEELVKFILSL